MFPLSSFSGKKQSNRLAYQGDTALHFSAANRDLNLTTLLIRHGAGPVQDNEGNTALHLALQSREKTKKRQNTDVAKLLINLNPVFARMKNMKG